MTFTDETKVPARTEADAVAEIATRRTDPIQRVDVPRTGDGPAVALLFDRDGNEVLRQDLDPTTARTVDVHTPDAVKVYCSPFARATDEDGVVSTLWADADAKRITVILDDHTDAAGNPATHRCRLDLKLDPDFQAWQRLAANDVDQDDLAAFLEERIHEVADPDGATLLAVAETLTATVNGKFSRATNLHNGSTRLSWSEDVEGQAGEHDIPNDIAIHLPIFRGGDPVTIRGKFRWRVRGGQLKLGIRLLNVHTAIDQAISDMADDIAGHLGLDVIAGTAPAATS